MTEKEAAKGNEISLQVKSQVIFYFKERTEVLFVSD